MVRMLLEQKMLLFLVAKPEFGFEYSEQVAQN